MRLRFKNKPVLTGIRKNDQARISGGPLFPERGRNPEEEERTNQDGFSLEELFLRKVMAEEKEYPGILCGRILQYWQPSLRWSK
jgi:hypothetical protein